MTVPDGVYLEAARAYCRAKFNYIPKAHAQGQTGADEHLARDAADTAEAYDLRAVVDVAFAAGVTEGRRQAGAEIEKLLRWCALNAGMQMQRYEPDSLDRVAFNAERGAFEWAARIATGDQP